MKQFYYALFTFALLFNTLWLPAQWTILDTPTEQNLVGIHFLDASTGITVGSNGTILKTIDGGDTWTSVFSGGYDFIRGQLVGNVGYAISDQGTIFKSLDVGNTWVSLTFLGYALRSVLFLDESFGFVGTQGGWIFRTINGGQTWSAFDTETSKIMRFFHFKDQDEGFVVGDGGNLLKTIDGGQSWFPIDLQTSEDLFCIYFFDEDIGYITGTGGTVFKTINGGNDWQQINFPVATQLRTIFFTSLEEGYTIGNDGLIFHTLNGGIDWTTNDSVTTNTLYQVHFAADNTGFISGANGTILRLKDMTVNTSDEIPSEIEEVQLFPNPAGQSVRILFQNEIHNFKKVEIFNLEGRLLQQRSLGDTKSVEIELAQFSNGMYLLSLENSNGQRLTKKLVVEKGKLVP